MIPKVVSPRFGQKQFEKQERKPKVLAAFAKAVKFSVYATATALETSSWHIVRPEDGDMAGTRYLISRRTSCGLDAG
ncbi:hypothetical protein CC2G_009796 [Coprinopsis cinerea AmutBmut pab1-1]|nr:hypothetical protein CC2G_009796 [Coprinopsis cinerea AmutBmut pab1-1]